MQNTNQARVAFKIIKSHGKKRVESTDQGRNIFDERAVTVKYPCQLPGFNNPKLLHPPHFGSYNANHFNRTCYSYCKNAAVHVSQPNSVSFAHPSSMSFWHSNRIHRSRSPFPCIHSSCSTHCGNSIIERKVQDFGINTTVSYYFLFTCFLSSFSLAALFVYG